MFLTISRLLSTGMTQLNDFDTDNENSKTTDLSVSTAVNYFVL